jgi:prefoldin subunit 5
MTNPDEPAAQEPPVIDHDPAPEPAPPTEAETRPPERPRAPVVVRGGGSNILTIVLFGLLAGALYYIWANPAPADTGATAALQRQVQTLSDQRAADQGAVQALTQQAQALADRVDRLEKAPAAAPAQAAPADLGDLPKRVDDLAAKLEALANRPAETAPAPAPDSGAAQQAVEDLGRRVGQSLDAQKASLDAEKAAVDEQKAALDQLSGRLDKLQQGAGQEAGAENRAVRLTRVQAALVALDAGEKLGDLPGAPPAISRFAKQAPPTEAALRESFPMAAAHAREVSRPDVSHRSFWERTLTRLQQSVTVRQGDDVLVGDPAAGILAEAGEKVDVGDLPGAVATLGKLNGPAADAMKEWVDQASALLAARTALADLAAHS